MDLPFSILFCSPPAVENMKPPMMIITKAKVPTRRLKMLIALRIIRPAGEVPFVVASFVTVSASVSSSSEVLKMSNTSKLDESLIAPSSAAKARGVLKDTRENMSRSVAINRFIWRDLTYYYYTWF